jgi:hypothetical protein
MCISLVPGLSAMRRNHLQHEGPDGAKRRLPEAGEREMSVSLSLITEVHLTTLLQVNPFFSNHPGFTTLNLVFSPSISSTAAMHFLSLLARTGMPLRILSSVF